MKKITALSIFITQLALLFQTQNVFAANSTITAIPPKLELNAEPGQIIKSTLKVRNDSETQQNFTIEVNDFIIDPETNTPIPLSENITSRWSLRKWITSPNLIPVDAGQTQNIQITIRVPASALPGGHYAMITYTPKGDVKPSDLRKTATLIGQRVGSLIYINVDGPITTKANLQNFTAPKFTEKGPVEFTGSVENLSDIHISPKGSITIKDIFNQEVAKLPIETGNIFPETTKKFTKTWDKTWGYGRYKAEIDLVYADNLVLSGLIYFWLFPITGILYTLLAIISILVIFIILNKRNKKHQQDLEKEINDLQKEIEYLEKK